MLENILQLIYSFILIVVNQERKIFLDVTMDTYEQKGREANERYIRYQS